MSQEQAEAIGLMFREIVNKYLNLVEDVKKWQERVRGYQEAAPLDRAVQEAVSRLWHMRRPEDVLEQISQFRRSYGGMALLLAPDPESRGEFWCSPGDPPPPPAARIKDENRYRGLKPRCQAMAELTGQQCRRPAASDSPFCHKHKV